MGILLFSASCSTDPIIVDDNLEGEVQVLGILSTAAPYQEVRIFRSRPILQAKGIEDAEVVIITATESYRLEHTGDGFYRDVHEKIPVRPGETYTLQVQAPNHEIIIGRTTIPQGLAIIAPKNGDTLFLEPDSLFPENYQGQVICKWEKARHGWISSYYHMTITNSEWSNKYSACSLQDSIFPGTIWYTAIANYQLQGLKIFVSQSDSALSSYSLIQEYHAFSCYSFFDGESDAYEKLFRLQQALRQKYPDGAVNLTGAKGVFGSVAVDSVELAIQLNGAR